MRLLIVGLLMVTVFGSDPNRPPHSKPTTDSQPPKHSPWYGNTQPPTGQTSNYVPWYSTAHGTGTQTSGHTSSNRQRTNNVSYAYLNNYVSGYGHSFRAFPTTVPPAPQPQTHPQPQPQPQPPVSGYGHSYRAFPPTVPPAPQPQPQPQPQPEPHPQTRTFGTTHSAYYGVDVLTDYLIAEISQQTTDAPTKKSAQPTPTPTPAMAAPPRPPTRRSSKDEAFAASAPRRDPSASATRRMPPASTAAAFDPLDAFEPFQPFQTAEERDRRRRRGHDRSRDASPPTVPKVRRVHTDKPTTAAAYHWDLPNESSRSRAKAEQSKEKSRESDLDKNGPSIKSRAEDWSNKPSRAWPDGFNAYSRPTESWADAGHQPSTDRIKPNPTAFGSKTKPHEWTMPPREQSRTFPTAPRQYDVHEDHSVQAHFEHQDYKRPVKRRPSGGASQEPPRSKQPKDQSRSRSRHHQQDSDDKFSNEKTYNYQYQSDDHSHSRHPRRPADDEHRAPIDLDPELKQRQAYDAYQPHARGRERRPTKDDSLPTKAEPTDKYGKPKPQKSLPKREPIALKRVKSYAVDMPRYYLRYLLRQQQLLIEMNASERSGLPAGAVDDATRDEIWRFAKELTDKIVANSPQELVNSTMRDVVLLFRSLFVASLAKRSQSLFTRTRLNYGEALTTADASTQRDWERVVEQNARLAQVVASALLYADVIRTRHAPALDGDVNGALLERIGHVAERVDDRMMARQMDEERSRLPQ